MSDAAASYVAQTAAPSESSPSPSPSPSSSSLPVSIPTPPPVTPGKPAPHEDEDPTMKLSRQRVREAREDTSGKVYRVYCDGVFDLFHLGHARMLEQAKKALGPTSKVYLLAGVCSDEDVHRYKGKTVMDHKIRCDSVRHCKWVDEVLEDAPWVIEEHYLQKYKIDFVAHDAIPYTNHTTLGHADDVYGYVKSKGMFLETQRTEGLSTSDLIVTIIRDYDDYVKRNLSRGYTKADLNIGPSWEMRSRFHENSKKVKESLTKTRENMHETSDALQAFISEFNPKYLLKRKNRNQLKSKRGSKGKDGSSAPTTEEDDEDDEDAYGPRYYMHRLKRNLPARRHELWHHSVGLACALVETTRYFVSYVNPLEYCGRKKYK